VRKEWRELLSSRAWWLMLALTGPLVGVSFITAVRTYSEASAGAALGGTEAFSPLDGIWAPTFSSFELITIFLLPFVAIRVVSADRQSGALKLELQRSMPAVARIAAKALVLFAGCLVAGAAGLMAVALWKAYGGTAFAPEILVAAFGHLLNAALTIALASAAASVAEHPSTAAILTLGFTVGTWAIDFLAAVHGGVWDQVAVFTPAAMVGAFQRGLFRADVLLTALAFIAAGLSLAGIWSLLGVSISRRLSRSLIVLAATATVVSASTLVRASWDASENRRNSFPEADEAALARIHGPLNIEVHLAQRDPRRFDLEHQALSKLRRIKGDVHVTYVARTSIGLYEQADPGYGEIRYELNGREAVSRMTTGEGVLETLYALAGVSPEVENDAPYRGHPLTAHPTGAAALFYGVWPAAVIALGFLIVRRQG